MARKFVRDQTTKKWYTGTAFSPDRLAALEVPSVAQAGRIARSYPDRCLELVLHLLDSGEEVTLALRENPGESASQPPQP